MHADLASRREGRVDLSTQQSDNSGAGSDVRDVVERQAGLVLNGDGREMVG
jgi:hypothetical protein